MLNLDIISETIQQSFAISNIQLIKIQNEILIIRGSFYGIKPVERCRLNMEIVKKEIEIKQIEMKYYETLYAMEFMMAKQGWQEHDISNYSVKCKEGLFFSFIGNEDELTFLMSKFE
jgi:hypothetical protein